MKKKKQPSRKSNKRLNPLLVVWVVGLFLLPIFYGIYLCTPQIRAAIAFEQPFQTQSYGHYRDLEIPLMQAEYHQQTICHAGYTVSYNEALRLPNWVAYELTREEAQGTEKRSDRFVKDPLVEGATAENADYARSGYDKGHMAPAADMKWSASAMKESFYFSNVCPQRPELNRRKWKDLEAKIRDWSIADSAVVVVCGPIADKRSPTIGRNRVVVPQRFFKVILVPYIATLRAIGFIFPNDRAVDPLRSYAVTVDSVERITGMDFFSALPDEQESRIEAELSLSSWGL